MKKEMMENATGVKLTKKASKNVIRSLSVGLAAMMALSTPIAAFAEDADGQNSSETTPEESTTTVTTQKSAAEQVGEVQKAAEETSKTTEAAKDAVNAAVDTTIADDSGADQTTKDAAGVLDATANGTFEGGTDVNVAEEIVDKTMDRIKDASDAAADTDAALDKADKKADEANTIADDAKKEQQEAQDAFDKAQAGIDSATDIEEAKNAYNQAAGIVGDAQKAYETAKAAYDSKVAEYNTALDELKAAQAAYDTAVAEASTEAAAAAANLAAVQEKAKALQEAAEEAKTAIPELTDAQKAALEIIALEQERAGDTSTNWRKEDELFKVILKNYYIPELAKGELVDCKWTWNRNDNKNYCEVTYKDVAGDTQTVYLNYKLNDTRDDLVIFEKAEEVVSYDVKGTDGSLAFNINAENFPADKLQNDQDTAVYENNGVVYTIVNIGGQFYVVDSASKDVEVNNNYNSEQYETSGEKKTTYSVDENGKLVKTVKQNVSEITYTETKLSSDKTYDNVEAAEKDLADKKAALKDGDKDVETSMSATATADVTVSQKTTFTTTIDLSKIVVEMKKINNDNDKYEKKNAEIAAKELFAKFTNKEALENLLGGDYKIESINTDNAKVNAVDKYKNTSGRWVDWGADSAAYKNVFSGTIVITYSQTVTAKADADSLKDKLTALLASQNYTADQVKELEGQISAAEIKLKEAEDMAKDLTDKLGIAGETLADKITELTPAPAPGEGGSTTTPGGTTSPSGTETTPGGAATTPAGTVTTAAAPASAVTTVTTATAAAAPVEIAETPVALAAAAIPAAATRTAVAANANAAADVDTDADADTDVTIADEETPLAADGAQESTTIGDEETPLAAEAGAVENKQQEKMSWWWLLIIALLGVTGEEMYRRNKKKKAEAAQKDEK